MEPRAIILSSQYIICDKRIFISVSFDRGPLGPETRMYTSTRVLQVGMRPTQLDHLIGQDDLVRVLKNKLQSGRMPHFFLFSGDVGGGKTTLARIVASLLQMPRLAGDKCPVEVSDDIMKNYSALDINEINAADKNGVDDIRELIKTMRYRPLFGSRAKVIIMDEAHQLSTAAQNALLKDTEEPPEHAYFIFCTSQKNKLIPAIIRRAEEFDVCALGKNDVKRLVRRASLNVKAKNDVTTTDEFINCLVENGITTPGIVLKACERYFNGSSVQASVFQTAETSLDSLGLCRAVVAGSWSRSAPILALMKKQDAIPVRCMVLGFLKSSLLRTQDQDKMFKYMNAMREISRTPYDDLSVLPATTESIARACMIISGRMT